jgi:hypothetical protein
MKNDNVALIIKDIDELLDYIDNNYNDRISYVYWDIVKFEDDWENLVKEHLAKRFKILHKKEFSIPEKTLIFALGTQYGLALNSYGKNSPKYAFVIGASGHSHCYGGLHLYVYDKDEYKKIK